jgi:glycosyltransferase involved in cell wall biosynthesis
MKVLFTTPILEHPAAGGPQLRIENSIKALSHVCELYIVARTSEYLMGGRSAGDYYQQFCRQFDYSPSGLALYNNRYLRKVQRIIYGLLDYDIARDGQFIIDLADKAKIDVLWFGYGNISFPLINYIKTARPDITVVCDTDSVWSRFVLRELPHQPSTWRKARIKRSGQEKEAEEKAWVNLCEITTAVSEVDAQYYKGLTPCPDKVQLFSNVIDLDTYQSRPLPPPGFKKPCMYLAGTFGRYHSPMDTAARWVLDEILPIVKKSIPEIHFYIVGSGSDRTLGHVAGDGITVTGKLESVLPYLCNSDVALVPLKFESGTRFKILEAAACGVPVVSTTLGAEGIPVTSGKDIVLADDASSFADAIVRIIRDSEYSRNLANNCRNLIQNNYSIQRLEKEARNILDLLSHD